MNPTRWLVTALALAGWSAPAAWAAPVFTVFEVAGADASDIAGTVDAFRAAIGGTRREINWDGVPDGRADPNALPGDFFNTTAPRGAVFTTPGSGFLVSARTGQPMPVRFGFGNDFDTFSAERLFTAVGSNTTDVGFFLPGTTTAATTSAFGLVFTDVEVAGLTSIEFFDTDGDLIFSRDALVSGNAGLSFVGAVVTGGSIARVRITSGLNTILAIGQLGNPNDDVVAMDDFIYADPLAQQVPLPPTLALGVLGLALLGGARRRKAG